MLLSRAPRFDPVNKLPHVVWLTANEPVLVDMGFEKKKNTIDSWEKRTSKFLVREEEMMVADLQNPIQRETCNYLRNMRWKPGLREAFIGD